MSGPATATSYEESVGSCCPPTPPTPWAPSAPRGAPVQRQLDFTGGGDLGDDDDEEFLCRVADDIERGYSEAKRRAPPCVCGRGVCAVERDDRSGRWKYMCPSWPKCNHVAFLEEVDLTPKPSNHNAINDPSNPCAFNNPSDHMAGPRTTVNVRPQITTLFSGSRQGAGAATLANISPHGEGAATLANDSPQGVCATIPAKYTQQGPVTTILAKVSPQGACATTPAKYIQQGAVTTTLAKVSPQGACATTPAKYIQQGAVTTTLAKVSLQGACATTPAKYIQQCGVTTTLAKVSPQGARSNCEEPVCQCTAGKCRKIRVGKDDYYVCPILKGKGACSYKVLVRDLVKDIAPCDEVHPESPPVMLHRPMAAVNTPSTKSPVRPYYGTPAGAIPPNPNNDICYRCREKGHWSKDCPKRSPKDSACFKCGMVGHWSRNCPQL